MSRKWFLLLFFVLLGFFATGCCCPNPFNNPASQRARENEAVVGNTRIGDIVMARGIGEDNRPLNTTNTFSTSEDVIYAVVQASFIEEGTTLFARWSREGEPFEDTPSITADDDYEDTYVEFHIEPETFGALQAGNYEVQIYVNGNPVRSKQFTVR